MGQWYQLLQYEYAQFAKFTESSKFTESNNTEPNDAESNDAKPNNTKFNQFVKK